MSNKRTRLEQLRQAYEAGILDEDTYNALATSLQEAAAVDAGSGAVAQGTDNTALGQRAVQTERSELIITGDNNSVHTIIKHFAAKHEVELDGEALRQQIGRYLTWLADWAGTLELRGIQRQGEQVVQLPLEKVYVPLEANTYGSYASAVDLNEILGLGRRLILTGGPGSGKTTVLLHIAWALSQAIATDDLKLAKAKVGFERARWKIETKDNEANEAQEEEQYEIETLPLPIFIPLSAYVLYRRSVAVNKDRTLAAFISQYLFDRQTSFSLPNDFFRHLLRQGQSVMLLLDGLDEVPDETERAQVRQAIEDLVTGRERMRVVVTCRTAAYQGRTALGKGFSEVSVRPLTQSHVNALIEQAYAHLYNADPLKREEKTGELLDGIVKLEAERKRRLGKDTPNLFDSPLLVRMLLIVHYRERRLPEQRAELYMKATDAMLLPDYAPDVEMADHIGQFIGGSWEVHRDMVQHLAFHMHQRGEQQGREIEEADLRQILALEPAYTPLIDEFIKLTRLRGTLLEERMGSYRFFHLAFQEFLTARYLAEIVRSQGGVESIVAYLEEGLLTQSWWREVVLLVAGYFGVTTPQTAQSYLERLASIDRQAYKRAALSPALQLAAAELAGVAWLEWPAQRIELLQRLAQRIASLFADENVMTPSPIALRISASHALANLGDPRPGVGVDAETGLPDILWSEEIPPGRYGIGDRKSKREDEKPREIVINQPFRLSYYPVTNIQFNAFVNASDCGHDEWWIDIPDNEKQFSEPKFPYANHPREMVSWYQATAFCRWLTVKLRAGDLPMPELAADPARYEIGLPHEYEWEIAARWPNEMVQERIYPWGVGFNATKANTWEGERVGQTTAVGIYPSGRNRALGLYDLSGNVWDWCSNKYDKPEETAVDHGRRVLRGGSWYSDADFARAVYRAYYTPINRNDRFGFRMVLRPLSHDP